VGKAARRERAAAAAEAAPEAAARPAPLLPAYVDPQGLGRDSLGPGDERSGDRRGLVRLREAEERAGRAYVASVEAQRAQDAMEVPGLSAQAWAAVRTVERTGEEAERAAMTAPPDVATAVWARLVARQDPRVAAWAREVEGKPTVAAELRAVAETAARRLGEDGARAAIRGARGAQDGPGQCEGLAGVGRALAAAQDGKLAQQAAELAMERQREAERERLGLRYGPRLGR